MSALMTMQEPSGRQHAPLPPSNAGAGTGLAMIGSGAVELRRRNKIA
jgi:hypothetical protein